MKTLLVAGFLLVSSATGAFAMSAASAQGSTDLSGAVGQSVGNGAAIVGLSVALPLAVSGEAGEKIATASYEQIFLNKHKKAPLPITDDTVLRGPAPDQALKSRQ